MEERVTDSMQTNAQDCIPGDVQNSALKRTTTPATGTTLVLGIGNILWADEGFGVRAVEAFHAAYAPTEGVSVRDGGTLGAYLLNDIEEADRLLVFDCCDFHEEPGTLRVLRNDDVRIWTSTKISPHQTGMNDLLAIAQIQGRCPKEIAIVGVQPDELNDYGGSLTKKVRTKVPEAVVLAVDILKEWGIELQPRAPGDKPEPLSTDSLSLTAYEAGRPSEEEACRIGDPRYFPMGPGPSQGS